MFGIWDCLHKKASHCAVFAFLCSTGNMQEVGSVKPAPVPGSCGRSLAQCARAMRLVNHPFRLDSQRLLSYLTSMRVLTLAVTPAISTTFWNTIYFYTASATAGNLSYDCARGRHCTVSAAASRRHVDASLDLFARKSPRSLRDLAGKRALSACARRLFFCGWWEYKLD